MEEQRWRGSSRAERSAERRGQLFEAGLELLGVGGGRALTVRSICREAGLSAKYFYESFTDRDHFLGQLYDSVIADLAAASVAATAPDVDHSTGPEGREARGLLTSLFRGAIGYLQADGRRARLVLTEPLNDDELRDRARQTYPRFVESLAPSVGLRFDGLGPGRELLPMASLGGALLLTFVTWLEGGTGESEEEFANFCVDVVLATPGVRGVS